MNSATQNPLSDDELLELAEFLVSDAVPETAMDIETLDGFLCALAVGPEAVTLGEALPYVWSDDPGVGAAPVWASPDQHGRITGLIGRMYAELAEAVAAEEQIEPLIVEPDGEDPDSEEMAGQLGMGWAMGFIAGMSLRVDAWQSWVANEGGDEDLKLIERLAGDEAPGEERKGLVDELPSLLEDCAGFWRGAAAAGEAANDD